MQERLKIEGDTSGFEAEEMVIEEHFLRTNQRLQLETMELKHVSA